MDNVLLKFSNFEYTDESKDIDIPNYNSIDLREIKEYIGSLGDEYFEWVKNNEGDTIEKIVHDYYHNDDYYDLILMINGRDMLFDMPYSYDIILNAIATDLQNYGYKVYGSIKQSLSDKASKLLSDKLDNDYSTKNQIFLYLKVIKIQYINDIRKKIADIIETQKNMYSLLDEAQ